MAERAIEGAGGLPPGITLRRAVAGDAQSIGAVFDAAVRDGWAYLGEVAKRQMFSAQHWDEFVADHAPPRALLVAADDAQGVVGFTAVHPEEGEMFLLFVDPAHAGRGVGRVLLDAAHDVLRAAGRREAFLFTEERRARPGGLCRGGLPFRRLGPGVGLRSRGPSRAAPGEAVVVPRINPALPTSWVGGVYLSTHV